MGKTQAAICLLSEEDCGSTLKLKEVSSDGQTVLEILQSKHPPQPCSVESLVYRDLDSPVTHPVVYEAIDVQHIRVAALHVQGAGGPFGTDALSWRRWCTAFKKSSDELCHAISLVTKKLCSSFVDPASLSPLLACRLVVFRKNPGVRPIGICETM